MIITILRHIFCTGAYIGNNKVEHSIGRNRKSRSIRICAGYIHGMHAVKCKPLKQGTP